MDKAFLDNLLSFLVGDFNIFLDGLVSQNFVFNQGLERGGIISAHNCGPADYIAQGNKTFVDPGYDFGAGGRRGRRFRLRQVRPNPDIFGGQADRRQSVH